MKLRKLGLLPFVICFAFSAQTAPPVLAHCGSCGSGETEPHAAPKKASVGHTAPAFQLSDLDGNKHSLAKYKGKTIVLEWFNPECPFVVAVHQKGGVLETMAQKTINKDTVWLAINSGAKGRQGHGVAKNSAAAKRWKIKHPILVDENGAVGKAYGAKTTPHIFVIDAQGKLVFKGAPDNAPRGKRGAAYKPYLSDALADLAAGKRVRQASNSSWGCSVKYGR
jgi:peroxiredoxin